MEDVPTIKASYVESAKQMYWFVIIDLYNIVH